MLSAVEGYYDGSHIVIDDDVALSIGQRVIVTILEKENTPEKKIDLKKYMGRGAKLLDEDATAYIRNLRNNDRS